MEIFKPTMIRPALAMLLLLIALLTSQHSFAEKVNPSADNFVNALIGQHKTLNNELINNQFKRPLVIYSTESSDSLKGKFMRC